MVAKIRECKGAGGIGYGYAKGLRERVFPAGFGVSVDISMRQGSKHAGYERSFKEGPPAINIQKGVRMYGI